MIIQGLNNIASSYGAISQSSVTRQAAPANAGLPAKNADTVSISNKAREALAALNDSASASTANADSSIEARLAAIKAAGPVNRSMEDQNFLVTNDKRLAEITAQGKSPDQLTAEDLDYMQKAGGFVNTMANLSPSEKALYDKAVASGNKDAAAGISQIALIRMGNMAGGANGTTYDPKNTEITSANIERYFSNSIVDPTGNAQSNFQALIQYLQNNPAA